MKYGLIVISLLLLLSFQNGQDAFDRLMGLQGVWERYNGKNILYESWKKGADGQLYGKSYTLSAQDTIPVETMTLRHKGKQIIFSAIDMKENQAVPTDFSLTKTDRQSFFFENPSHDYPKRIVYDLVSKDSLHAWIDGGPNEKDSRVDFYFRRVK
jgi:Domain of unknown function (DUF6265)